jgi:hypothetical protein
MASPRATGGGVIVDASSEGIRPPTRIETVTCEWTIPTITRVAGDSPQPLVVSFFVGIDGFSSGTNQLVRQLLRVGVQANLIGTSVDYLTWTQWWPNAATTVSNFPVKAGDVVSVIIRVPEINQASASLENRTSGKSLVLEITPPRNVTSQGASAEWLVERSSVDLPRFSPVTFTNISFGTGSRTFNLSNRADDIITNITSANGRDLASTSILSPTSAQVKWLASS